MIRHLRLSGAALAVASAVTLAGAATPAAATPVMTPETCAAGWRAIAAPMVLPRYLREAKQIVTEDGWCRMDRSTTELRSYDFAALTWRALGVIEAAANNVPPQSFEAEFTGILWDEAFDMRFAAGQPPESGAIRFHARHDPDSRTLVLDDLTFDFGALGRLQFTGQGAGFDFSSLAALQFSIGGMRLHRLTLDATLTAPLSEALQTSLAPADGAGDTGPFLTDLVAAIPASALSTEDRITLGAFLAALPRAAGALSITATSDTGLGALQIGAARSRKAGTTAMPDILDIVFSGVTLAVDWIADD